MTAPEIVDQAVFNKMLDSLGGDIEFMNEVIQEYINSSPILLTSMQKAIAAGDAPTLQRAAHSLKSGSAGFGALAFAAQCKDLEDIGKAGALDRAEEKYHAIVLAYPMVVAALQTQVERARSTTA